MSVIRSPAFVGVVDHAGATRAARAATLSRHDVRLRPQRLEKRPPVCGGRVTRRSSTARSPRGDRARPRPGSQSPARSLSHRASTGRRRPSFATTSGREATAARSCPRLPGRSPGLRPRSGSREGRPGQPDDECLMKESLEIGPGCSNLRWRHVRRERTGCPLPAFDTICSATPKRSAGRRVRAFWNGAEPSTLMVVVGATTAATRSTSPASARRVSRPSHIAMIPVSSRHAAIRHRHVGRQGGNDAPDWLPTEGPVRVGLSAGASTPDNSVGASLLRLAGSRARRGSAVTPPPPKS